MDKTKYTIYQVSDSSDGKKAFASLYDKANFNPMIYIKIWEGEYEPTEEDDKLEYADENVKLLNNIVKSLNADLPRGFYGHMISISDLIAINDEAAWYVNETGYVKLDDEDFAKLPA